MRGLIWLIPLLCGCSTTAVRYDAHLLPINAPAASVPAASIPAASVKAAAVVTKAVDARSAP